MPEAAARILSPALGHRCASVLRVEGDFSFGAGGAPAVVDEVVVPRLALLGGAKGPLVRGRCVVDAWLEGDPKLPSAPVGGTSTSVMSMSAPEFYEAGFALRPSVRKDVALRFLESIEVVDQESVDDAWTDEIFTRLDDILSGKARPTQVNRCSLSWQFCGLLDRPGS